MPGCRMDTGRTFESKAIPNVITNCRSNLCDHSLRIAGVKIEEIV
jgi:hypothetical protein